MRNDKRKILKANLHISRLICRTGQKYFRKFTKPPLINKGACVVSMATETPSLQQA